MPKRAEFSNVWKRTLPGLESLIKMDPSYSDEIRRFITTIERHFPSLPTIDSQPKRPKKLTEYDLLPVRDKLILSYSSYFSGNTSRTWDDCVQLVNQLAPIDEEDIEFILQLFNKNGLTKDHLLPTDS
jgi:hypothetical protein